MLANLVDNDDINVNEDNGTGFRFTEYPYSGGVHSMTTTGERLQKFISENGTRTEHNTDSYDYGLRFTENAAPTGGSVANNVRIVFPGTKITSFEYSADKTATPASTGTPPSPTPTQAKPPCSRTCSFSPPIRRSASTIIITPR